MFFLANLEIDHVINHSLFKSEKILTAKCSADRIIKIGNCVFKYRRVLVKASL